MSERIATPVRVIEAPHNGCATVLERDDKIMMTGVPIPFAHRIAQAINQGAEDRDILDWLEDIDITGCYGTSFSTGDYIELDDLSREAINAKRSE